MGRVAPVAFGLIVIAAVVHGCGSDDGTPLADRLTAQATGVSTQPLQKGPTTAPPSTPRPTPDAATALQVRSLSRLLLVPTDIPGTFDTLNNQEATRDAIIVAQAGIPGLQSWLQASDLLGGWAALYSNPEPPGTFVSSIAYLFGTPAGAAGLVQASGEVEVSDYSGALEAAQLPADPVGDGSVLMRYRTADGYSYELTWADGPVAGQVIVRYETEPPPDATQFIGALAAIQAARMDAFTTG